MPILRAEPCCYPPRLFDGEEPPRDPERRWMCLHTKPRQEKAIARDLHALGICHYLPLAVHESTTPAGRKIRSIIPMFTSYLFLWGGDRERVEAMKAQRLVHVLEVPDQRAIDEDLRGLHRLVGSGLVVRPEPSYPVGTRVRITSGPLANAEGVIVQRGRRDQFVAIVRFLGQGAAIDLQDWQVEKVEG